MNPIQIGPIPGVTDLTSLIDFLQNPKPVAERVKKLEDIRKKVNEDLKALKVMKDLRSAESLAAIVVRNAESELRNAKEEAAEVRKTANDAAVKISQKVKEDMDAHTLMVNEWATERRALQKTLRDSTKAAETQLAQSNSLMQEAEKKLGEAEKIREEYTKKARDLKSIIA